MLLFISSYIGLASGRHNVNQVKVAESKRNNIPKMMWKGSPYLRASIQEKARKHKSFSPRNVIDRHSSFSFFSLLYPSQQAKTLHAHMHQLQSFLMETKPPIRKTTFCMTQFVLETEERLQFTHRHSLFSPLRILIVSFSWALLHHMTDAWFQNKIEPHRTSLKCVCVCVSRPCTKADYCQNRPKLSRWKILCISVH